MRISQLPRSALYFLAIFLMASLLIPLPYAVLQPGAGQDVLGSVIKISGTKTYKSSGKLLLTTIYVTSPSSPIFGADVLFSWFKGEAIVMPREVLYPPNKSSKEINAENAKDMVNSQESATVAALTYLGYDIPRQTSTGKDGKRVTVYDFPVNVSISLKDTGGPSGGLVFGLGIVEKLTPEDIVAGRTIAGTGTIDSAGNIGAIGGIGEKIIAAKSAGASVFLAPSENCADVTHLPSGIKVYSVATLKEAISVLKDARNAIPHCTWQRNR
ncbi:MAG: S16 family serine protease [Candidatus Nanopelagicaceae bacterium]